MIAFNFNIHFQDEPSLSDHILDINKDTINIVKSFDLELFSSLPVKHEYIDMSGRQACYAVDRIYSECRDLSQLGVDVKNLVSFVWSYGQRTLFYLPQEDLTPALLQFWVLHTIIPMMLSIDETYTFLHVGSIEISGEPILFSAESFGGKSTLIDYFIKKGHILLSDDTLGVYYEDDTFKAIASYPYHRPYREAESLGYKVKNTLTSPKKVKATYLLERSDAHSKVIISEVKGVEKYRALHFSVFINFDCLKDVQFKTLSSFVNVTSVYKVTLPWDLARLNEVYDAIIRHNT